MFRFGKILAAGLLAAGFAVSPGTADEFKWADSRSLSTLEPYFGEIFRLTMLGNMYEPLTGFDTHGDLVAKLAESWEAVEPTRWRFKLRQGVKFHDGDSFNADDVIFSIRRGMHPNSTIRPGGLGLTEDVVKVDDYTVDFITSAADPILPRFLTNVMMMSKEWSEANNAVEVEDRSGKGLKETGASRHVNGTGPFKLVEWVPGASLEFAVNSDWWDGARTDRMTSAKYFEIVDPATQLAALLAGDIDMVLNVRPDYVERIQSTPGFSVISGKSTLTNLFMFDVFKDELPGSDVKGKNPFKDARVRHAVNLAINVQSIVDRVMKGMAYPANLPISSFAVGYSESYNLRSPADPERAKQLLSEAGYPDGFTVPMQCPTGAFTHDEAICLAVSSMLARIGIQTTISTLPMAGYYTMLQAPTYGGTFYLIGWNASAYDAGTWVTAVMRSRDPANGLGTYNYSGFSEPDIDELATKIRSEMDPAKRQKLFEQVWEIINSKALISPLFQQAAIWAAKDGINVTANPLNVLSLTEVTLN
jgi:peptide/nickel transport system substrate-binding protein